MTDSSADVANTAEPLAAVQRRSSKLRAVFAGVLGVLAVLALIASVVAVWARGVLFDSSKVAGAVDAAMQDPAVTDAAAAYLTDQLMVVVDVEGFVTNNLDGPLKRFAPAIVGGIDAAVEKRVNALLSLDATRHLIVGLVERSHAQLMRLLEGDGLSGAITVKDGAVTVNLLPVLGLALNKVHDFGLLDNVTLPELTRDGDPAKQIAALEKATGRDLPNDFGQLVVYRSEALANAGNTLSSAQHALVLLKRAMALIVVLTVALLVATVLVANRRRRAVAVIALVSAFVLLITRALIAYVVGKVPSLLVKPGARAALANSVKSLAGSLLSIVTALAILGLLVAAWLWLTGPSDRARALRGRAGTAGDSAGSFIARRREASAVVAFSLATLVFLVGGFGIPQFVAAGLLAVAGCWIYWGPADRSTPPAA
jgi:hypothetical protein